MVSSKALEELRMCYGAVQQQSINISEYSGTLFDILFDIITAETYIAGIASKILDGEDVEPVERKLASKPFLIDGHLWQLDNGQIYDVQNPVEVCQYAVHIERLREKCHEILVSIYNS
jgi:hypothetical protein